MKLYVLYNAIGDSVAIHMSTSKECCEREAQAIKERYKDAGYHREINLYIKEYDFSKNNSFELDC